MSKKIISLVLAGLISVSAYVHSYANGSKNVEGVKSATIQEKEPNNTTAEAQEIGFNEKISGFKDKKDFDFFKFTMPTKANLYIDTTIHEEGVSSYAELYVFDLNGKRVGYFPFLDCGINQLSVELEKGTYYIMYRSADTMNRIDFKYDLTISINYFSDVKGHWAENQINNFVDLGYVGGYSDGTFKPNSSITRAEFVKILNNAFGLTKFSGKLFSDTQNHWARKDIDIAVTNGVCNGKSATEFKPNDPITREEAAVMIANYKKIKDTNHDKVNIFYDNKDVSSWAKDGVEGVVERGYMGGYDDNTFKPKGNITRAEAVVTLSRVHRGAVPPVVNTPIPKFTIEEAIKLTLEYVNETADEIGPTYAMSDKFSIGIINDTPMNKNGKLYYYIQVRTPNSDGMFTLSDYWYICNDGLLYYSLGAEGDLSDISYTLVDKNEWKWWI